MFQDKVANISDENIIGILKSLKSIFLHKGETEVDYG
jgi:hypothetical protein